MKVISPIKKIKWLSEAATQRYSLEKVFWKYAANLHEDTMSKCDFNKVAKQLYWNCTSALVFSCKFSEHLFLRTPPGGCFSTLIRWFSIPKFLMTHPTRGVIKKAFLKFRKIHKKKTPLPESLCLRPASLLKTPLAQVFSCK